MSKFTVEYSKNNHKYMVLFESEDKAKAEQYYTNTKVEVKDRSRLVEHCGVSGTQRVLKRSAYTRNIDKNTTTTNRGSKTAVNGHANTSV